VTPRLGVLEIGSSLPPLTAFGKLNTTRVYICNHITVLVVEVTKCLRVIGVQ
jgi:hypothetical protein